MMLIVAGMVIYVVYNRVHGRKTEGKAMDKVMIVLGVFVLVIFALGVIGYLVLSNSGGSI